MKNNKTISFSLPETLAAEVDSIAADMHISRSALLTAAISVALKWLKQEKEV